MRFRTLLRLFVALLLIFVTQKVLFMLYNLGMADGVPFSSCLASLWHGLSLDIATACYLVICPALALMLSPFFSHFPLRKVLMPYYILVAAVLALIFVADTVLYGFWGAKLDANDLIYAAKPKDMLASLPWWATLLAFVVIAGVAWGYVSLLRWVTPREISSFPCKLKYIIQHSAFIIIAVPLIFLGMRGGVTQSTANPSYAYFSAHPFCNHAALNPAFNIFHSLFKVQDLKAEFNRFSEDELESIIGDVYAPDPSLADTLLRIDRPNVLFIIWEGGGMGMVGSDSVAPYLHALRQEGVWFSNCYANSFRTDRGLIAALSGWLGMPTLSLMKRTDLCRCLPSIASSLKNEGYNTSMTYGGDIDFTNMRLYFSETGFSEVHGSEYFSSAQNESAWGVPDHYVLTPALVPTQRPFLSAVLTLSSHEPWQVPMRRLCDDRMNSFAYTDSCIGALLGQLKTTPLWDSLLVVIVPDHGITFGEVHSSADARVAYIPMLWVGGALKKAAVIDVLMNQTDLVATLLAQMHVDVSPFRFSRNVLGIQYAGRRQFALHSDKNHVNLIAPDTVYSYDCVSRSMQPESDENKDFVEAVLQRLYHTTVDLPALRR